MKEKYTVRRIEAGDDLVELTELLHRSYKKLSDDGMRYLASYQDIDKTKERCAEGQTIVVEFENKIIGTITVNFPENHYGGEYYKKVGVTSFHQFAICPRHQGVGVGSLLLSKAEQIAKEEGVIELAFDTSERALQLISFYKKRGYKLVDEWQWEHTNYKSLIFSKIL